MNVRTFFSDIDEVKITVTIEATVGEFKLVTDAIKKAGEPSYSAANRLMQEIVTQVYKLRKTIDEALNLEDNKE